MSFVIHLISEPLRYWM